MALPVFSEMPKERDLPVARTVGQRAEHLVFPRGQVRFEGSADAEYTTAGFMARSRIAISTLNTAPPAATVQR